MASRRGVRLYSCGIFIFDGALAFFFSPFEFLILSFCIMLIMRGGDAVRSTAY